MEKKAFVKANELYQWKYLLDIRGYGWTDRVKLLLASGRVLLLVERPYREYYFDLIKPMVHYVPIEEDLSDLINKIHYLDENPEVYNDIVENAVAFVKENFKKEKIIKYMAKCVLDNSKR